MRALDAEIARADLGPRDSALATEIVYGSLRVLPELDARLQVLVRRGLENTDALTLAVLRAATYQMWHLGRLPTHAIVDEAVGLVRRARGKQNGGFVNAVLRRLATERPTQPEPAHRVVFPEWLQAELQRSLGAERAAAFCAARPGPPPLCLAVAPAQRLELAARVETELKERGNEGEVLPGTLSPLAICTRRAGDVRCLPAYAAGAFWVQEEGAQLVALAVNPQPAERVADLCAGHGGKTLCLSALQGGQGHITAVDVDETKLDALGRELERLGWQDTDVQCEAIDLSVGSGGLGANYDRVLLDAPCSGLGTVLRRPELLLRLQPEDLARLAALQFAMTEHALALLRPGGQLYVAVCSPLAQEGSELAARLRARFPQLQQVSASVPEWGLQADEDDILRIGPWQNRGPSVPDAYQVLHFRLEDSGPSGV